MKRTSAAAGLMVMAMLAFGPELNACGDKSLSAGGIRMQRAIAARYPASILIYAPATSRLPSATRELKLPETLNKVGHKYREVATLPELQALVDSGQYNIVLADFAQLAEVQQQFESSPSRVVIVPVAYNLTKAEAKEAAKQSRYLINAPSRPAQYLATIAEAVRSGSSIPRKG